MGLLEVLVIPPCAAESDEVDERAERHQLEENPRRHALLVFLVNGFGVLVSAVPLELGFAIAPTFRSERGHVVGDDGVPVFVVAFGDVALQVDLAGVLDVPRHNEQDLAKHLVQFSEDDQLGEVEVGVLSVALPALALGEQLSVGRKLIEVALVREIGCRPLFAISIECDALCLQMGYLLGNGELWLVVISIAAFARLLGLAIHFAPLLVIGLLYIDYICESRPSGRRGLT